MNLSRSKAKTDGRHFLINASPGLHRRFHFPCVTFAPGETGHAGPEHLTNRLRDKAIRSGPAPDTA